jgi:hypothetical protein
VSSCAGSKQSDAAALCGLVLLGIEQEGTVTKVAGDVNTAQQHV